jgi:hypothetical protein
MKVSYLDRITILLSIFIGLFICPGQLRAAEGQEVVCLVRFVDKGAACTAAPGSVAFEDAPLDPAYVAMVVKAGAMIRTRLKWQNAVSARCPAACLANIKSLRCVREVLTLPRPMPRTPQPPAQTGLARRSTADIVSDTLLAMHNMKSVLDSIAARGQQPGAGVKIAFLDDSFLYGNTMFAPLRNAGRIADQWDFVDNAPTAVFADSLGFSHGGMTSSLVIGNEAGEYVGIAPQATLLLYRCENGASEGTVEEDYVAAGIERAVDSGAQVISISLGYRYDFDGEEDHPFTTLDGRTLPASVAAVAAARRNVVVCISMGNDGNSANPYVGGPDNHEPTIGSPADADSILAVGAVEWDLINKTAYSSIGPTADRRIKPDVCATGYAPVAMVANGSGVEYANGTSFSAPITAGACVLLRQLFPHATAAAIRQALMETAGNAQNPDTLTGWGCINTTAAAEFLSKQLPLRLLQARHIGVGSIQIQAGRGACRVSGSASPSDMVRLYDCQGRLLVNRRFQAPQVRLDHLTAGMYVVVVGRMVQAVMIQ